MELRNKSTQIEEIVNATLIMDFVNTKNDDFTTMINHYENEVVDNSTLVFDVYNTIMNIKGLDKTKFQNLLKFIQNKYPLLQKYLDHEEIRYIHTSPEYTQDLVSKLIKQYIDKYNEEDKMILLIELNLAMTNTDGIEVTKINDLLAKIKKIDGE